MMAAFDIIRNMPISPVLLKFSLLLISPVLLLLTAYFFIVPNVFKVSTYVIISILLGKRIRC